MSVNAPVWLLALAFIAWPLAAVLAMAWQRERRERRRLSRRRSGSGGSSSSGRADAPTAQRPARTAAVRAAPVDGDDTPFGLDEAADSSPLPAAAAAPEAPDPLHLPGLMASAGFERVLDKAAQAIDRQRGTLVLLAIHLERMGGAGLKPPGPVGEAAMRAVVQRLTTCVGGRPLAMRPSPDDLLLLHTGDLASACTLAGRLTEALGGGSAAAAAGGRARSALGCAIGLAAYPLHGTRGRLAAHAGFAALAAQRAGGGGYMVFAPHMAEDQRDHAQLLADLRQALVGRQFELYYQPKVSARSLRLVGAEALLRWHHPTRGIVSPALFVPMAEQAGLIGSIGDWVIGDACRQIAAWREQGLRLPVALNLSAFQMRQDHLVGSIETQLRRHGVGAAELTLEIPESVAFEDTQVVRRAFERLRDLGVQVSVDDFGAGQAQLGALRELLVTELKVDAGLVREVTSRPDVRGIVDAMVRLAHALQMKVVAMGVETEDQRDRLVTLGCDELQGFLFAKPMAAARIAAWAAEAGDSPAQPAAYALPTITQ